MEQVSNSERLLARALDKRGLDYFQQKKIEPYTVDFFLPPKLIVEVEGAVHTSDERSKKDQRRHMFLEGSGYVVLRISTRDVQHDPDGNARFIEEALKKPEKYRMYRRIET